MKVTIEKKVPVPVFNPIELTLRLDTREEAEFVGTLFNACFIVDAVSVFKNEDGNHPTFSPIYTALKEAGVDINYKHSLMCGAVANSGGLRYHQINPTK